MKSILAVLAILAIPVAASAQGFVPMQPMQPMPYQPQTMMIQPMQPMQPEPQQEGPQFFNGTIGGQTFNGNAQTIGNTTWSHFYGSDGSATNCTQTQIGAFTQTNCN